MIKRRHFLVGLAAGIAAPFIVRPDAIMRIKPLVLPPTIATLPPPELGMSFDVLNASSGPLQLYGWSERPVELERGEVAMLVYLGEGHVAKINMIEPLVHFHE